MALDRFWNAMDSLLLNPPPPLWRIEFTTAVGEIVANIVRHTQLIGAEATFRFSLRLYADRAEARFIDRGIAFRGSTSPTPALTSDPLELPEGGFGLAIARATLHQLVYKRTHQGSNCWRLVKRFSV